MKSGFNCSSNNNSSVVLGEGVASDEVNFVFPSEEFSQQAHVSSIQKYVEMYGRSVDDPAGFWSDIASNFYWKHKWGRTVYTHNLDIRKGKVNIEWFKGGKTNMCYNCLDRNIDAGNGDKFAILWEGNDPGRDATLTYTQLLARVCQLANYLKNIGVGKGDAVIIYLPMLLELPIAMLACARIGAIHSVVFAGFSAESLSQRILDCKPKVVITCNAVRRGPKTIFLKDIVDDALTLSAQNAVNIDLCLTFENESALQKEMTKWVEGRDIWWQVLAKRIHDVIHTVINDSQAGFIPGRKNSDNIILAHELVKAYTRKSASPRCMLKIDLQKAYDSVEWCYLEQVMKGLGFPDIFTNWVLTCMKTVSYSTVVNGTSSQAFVAAKGFRQGDHFLCQTIRLNAISDVNNTKKGYIQ